MRNLPLRDTRMVVVLVIAGALLLPSLAAAAQSTYEWPSLSDLGFSEPTDKQLESSVTRYQTEGTVRSVETVEEDGAETVVNLDSDILFATDESDLSDDAARRIGELVADIPDGATVDVHGHTDTVGEDSYNLDLSQRRADSVATAIAAARPDLELNVQGFGETDLKVPESGDDIAEDRAANRRVELRFTS